MKIPLEIDYIKMDGKKGALILKNDGIYVHPYDMSKRPPYLMGDSLVISDTGIFGAFNLMKKLSNTKNLHEIAKDIRDAKGLEELVKLKEVTFFSWNEISSVKKNWLTANIVVRTKTGNKIKIRVTEIKKEKEVTSFLSGKISSNY